MNLYNTGMAAGVHWWWILIQVCFLLYESWLLSSTQKNIGTFSQNCFNAPVHFTLYLCVSKPSVRPLGDAWVKC